MKTLLILRHAKSSWDESGLNDFDRPLNKRGERDAPRIGKLLVQECLVPEYILSSSAKRARMTAEAVAVAAGFDGEVDLQDGLYGAGPDDWIVALSELDDALHRVLVVGHNPGLEELLASVTGVDEAMPTAALAHVSLPIDAWDAIGSTSRGKLIHLWRPKEME